MDLIKNTGERERNIAAVLTSDVKKDLHIHTCYSDGALTPQEVVDRWMDEGYELIAVTDHDGIEGSIEGMSYAAGKDIRFISGIEFDSENDLCKDMHVLGYGFDYNCREIRNALSQIRINRARRNDVLMAALRAKGYRITLDDIGEINEGRYVGKPTFAQILYKKGYTSDPQEAFYTVFTEPEIRSICKTTLQTRKVVDLIHAAGGLAIVSHPMEQRQRGESFKEFSPRLYYILDRMREYGFDGIECHHPSADDFQQELLCDYADRYGLLITGGSDFHRDTGQRDFSRYHMP